MKQRSFKVRIRDVENLYQDLVMNRISEDYGIGELWLEKKPLEAIDVRCSKIKDKFSVYFNLEAYSQDKDNISYVNLEIPLGYLAETKKFRFEVMSEDQGQVMILDETGKDEFYIKMLENGDLQIGFGYFEVPSKKIISVNNFEAVLTKMGSLVEDVVVGLCRACAERIPRDTLFLVTEEELIRSQNDFGNNTDDDVSGTQVEKKAERKGLVPVEKIDFGFEAIGGQTKAKQEIMDIANSLKYPTVYQSWGTRAPKGVLLWGPSGTGKTILAKALASAIDASFYNVKLSEVFTKWYGESSNNIQRLFNTAIKQIKNTSKPAMIFFDEIDALVGDRDGMHEESQRVTQAILTNLDGLEPISGLTVIAASNRKDIIDKAFLRPGRIDRLVEVPLPNALGRLEIMLVHMNASQTKAGQTLFALDSFDGPVLAQRTKGMSGAEIAEIVRRALEDKAKLQISSSIRPAPVTMEDIMYQINNYEQRSINKTIGFQV